MKAVLYCRVDGPQTSFALDAIKGQQLYLMDYAKKNNIEIAGIYLDVGYHGRTMDRPGLQSVIQTLKEGNADVILVANYNRLYRGRFPKICGKRILFLIRRFYREINGKGTGTNEKR